VTKNNTLGAFLLEKPTTRGKTLPALSENTILSHIPAGMQHLISPVVLVPVWTGSFLMVA
jgi:hypothetical protein